MTASLGKGSITATAWLEDFLRSGAKTVGEIRDAATTAHFKWGTIHAAKELICAYSPTHGIWALKDQE